MKKKTKSVKPENRESLAQKDRQVIYTLLNSYDFAARAHALLLEYIQEQKAERERVVKELYASLKLKRVNPLRPTKLAPWVCKKCKVNLKSPLPGTGHIGNDTHLHLTFRHAFTGETVIRNDLK